MQRRIALAPLFFVCLIALNLSRAQTPVALPYTMATAGGLSPMAAAAGTQCPNLATGVLSTDAYGDGCLAVNGIFGAAAYSGVAVDAFGDVFVNDDIKGVLHMINANSGIMSLVAGGNSACSGKQDSSGDGCVAATGTPAAAITGARGVGIDPYGNIVLAGYGDHLVHMICRNASPLCVSGTPAPSAASPIQIQIGNMGLAGGCAYSSGSSGVTGTGTDNTPAFSTPAAGFAGSPFVNAGVNSSSCTVGLGEVNAPRGATADAYGNVYYGDTGSYRLRVVLGPQSYNGVTNPLWAVLEQNASWYNGTTKFLTAGYVYTLAGITTTATTKGASCAGSGTATDTHGDGCLFTAVSVSTSGSYIQAAGVDAAGNVVFTDPGNGLLRVLFVSGSGTAGAAMVNAIEANNSGMSPATPQAGFVYSLAGGGSTGGISTTPYLGNSRTALDTSTTKLAISPQGNIFIGDKTRVLFFDIDTGYIRTLFAQSAANVSAGSYCNGTSGQKSLSAYSDGCAASQAEFGNSNGLSVGVDSAGNLYLYDGTSSGAGQLVRKVLAQGLAGQTLGTALTQTMEVHLPETASGTVSGSTAAVTATPDMTAAAPECVQNGDNSVDCTVAVTATPSAAGQRSAAVTVTLPAGVWTNPSGSAALNGTIAGSVLAVDNVATTANSVTTPVAPATSKIFNAMVPAGVAVDGAGNVYVMDSSSGSILESVQGAAGVVLSASLPVNPGQLAVDALGDVFAVGSGTPAIKELKVSGAPAAAGAPASFTPVSIAYSTLNAQPAAPQAVAVDNAGNLYVADKQSAAANTAIYRLSLVDGAVQAQQTVATGFTNPVSLAVDSAGNVFVADKGASAVYKLAPGAATGAYTQTTVLPGVVPVALAADAAGDVYVQDQSSASIIEVPVSGPETAVLTGLQNPDGLAVDGLGDVFSADASQTGIVKVVRDAGAYGSTTTPLTSITATLTNVGNQAATGVAQTDASAFTLTPSGCTIGSANAFAAGLACSLTVTLSSAAQTPGSSYSDTLSFLPAGSFGAVSFSDVVPAGLTSTSVSGPSSALFAASGVEATFTASVTGLSAPSGTQVTVTVSSLTSSGTTVVSTSTTALNSSGQATVNLSGLAAGNYSIAVSYAGVTNVYEPSSASANFTIEQWVATGDSRAVSEPSFPAVCTTLQAGLAMVNDDIPASLDATVTNPDGARIQAALNACAGSGQAVELSVDGAGNNAFLTGPLSMPSNVTLLVDPGVVLFFSRNAQDYDKVAGTNTCGTVNNNSATSSCRPLIEIPGTSTNVGIMGYGKLDGRGGDPLINAIAPYQGYSWWGLSSAANGVGNQQNPRFIQMDTGASNITLYKITMRNSPLFHVSTTGGVSNFTAWDVKIITPTSSRNTDGIDPGNAQNFTITRSWISDGDDNVAIGASGTAPSANISVTNNHFFAGHGESIGSYTQAGVSNVLFDGNMLAGNSFGHAGSAFGYGSTLANSPDSNSTGIRIKSANDRGGLVTDIQYSNSCFLDHKSDIQFTPLYNTNSGTLTPNFTNILLQNLVFMNDAGSAGSVQFTGAANGGTTNPLQVTLDNVTFPSTFGVSNFVTTGTAGTETNAQLSYGPGLVSSNFVSGWATFAGANGDTVTDNRTATGLQPPTCNFTYIAPELTGPNGLPQTINFGANATAVVILTPAVGGAPYPTGTVTLTDALTSNATTVTLTGTTDTILIPLTGLAVGTHSFTATYSGDANYPLPNGASYYTAAGPYTVTVNAAALGSTTTVLSGVPAATTYGTAFTAAASVTGSNPTGTVEFLVNGVVYATAALNAGAASASISLPYSTSAYGVQAVYSGDGVNAGSVSSIASVTVEPALTTTALTASTTSTPLGHPVLITAAVSSAVGTPTGNVTFSYTPSGSATPVTLPAVVLNSGVVTASIDLPLGNNAVTASYAGSGSFAASASTPMTITINPPTIVPLPNNPIPLPYTISTIAGGASVTVPGSGNMACAGATDKYGDGCQGTAIALSTGDDLRGVTADPFGNVYFTDISATLIRKIAPNGVITNFAGRVSGTACVPTASTGCTPTLVSLSKPRGVASDWAGNIYVADYSGNKVYKIPVSTGLMYLVAGTGTAGFTGDGGPATAATVDAPRGAWGDPLGNVYIADTTANKIRVVDAAGNIHTFAGTGTASSTGDGGPATAATINNPQSVLVDANLNVYVADSSGGKIRVVCVTCGTNSPLDGLLAQLGINAPVNGDIYTIAGGASSSYAGAYPTLATNVSMSPQKLAIDLSGDLYISDGNGVIWFLDARTAQIRPIASNAASVCAAASNSVGDGCPATQAQFGNGGNGIGVGTDALGNVYLTDTADLRIRKVSTNLAAAATAAGSTSSAPVELHFIPGDSLASANGIVANTTEWSATAPACATNSDTTSDCMLTLSFTPAVPGARWAPVTINSSLGNTAHVALTGTSLGAGATLDPASQVSFGKNLQVAGLATDSAGNIYVSDASSKKLLRFAAAAAGQGSSASATALATLIAPGAVAVDGRGYVYVADTSAGTVTQISPAGAASVLPFTFTTPAGLAVDAANNLYVSDSAAKVVYQINPIANAEQTLPLGTLAAPAGLAMDPAGNLLVADPGAPALYRFNLATGVTSTVTTSAVAPAAVVTDAAGNLLIADTAAILAVPASSNSAGFTVATLAPAALAIDSAGNLYTGLSGGVLKLQRTQGYVQYATAAAGPQAVHLLNAGNQVYQATAFTQTDAPDYSLAPAVTADCALGSTGAGMLALGGACTLTATYTPTTYVSTTDTVTFNGNLANAALSTPATVNLVLTGPATAPASTITLGAFAPASPIYGQSVTLSATVSGSAITPAGTVVFTVDSTTYNATVTGGTASTTVSGLTAGQHTVSATYTSSNGYKPATSASGALTVAQATPTISWATPAAIAYGVALSATQLNATSTVPGKFVYTPAAGAILAAGNQTLSVTLTPTDTIDYTTATQTVALTVNKAGTTTALKSSSASITPGQSVTFTATVTSATTGTPTGTVSFYDGGTLLGTGTLAGGAATYSTAALSAGSTHVITAVYGGDANFNGSNGSTAQSVVVAPLDFTITLTGSSVQSVIPGQSIVYQVLVSPNYGSYAGTVSFAVSGLPPGATVNISPATIAANGGAQTVTITIQTAPAVAMRETPPATGNLRGRGALALAVLLIGIGGLRSQRRRLRRFLCLLLLLAGSMGAVLVSGCGGAGFFTQAPQSYTVTITATAGGLQHTATVTINEQ